MEHGKALRDEQGRFLPGSKPSKAHQQQAARALVEKRGTGYLREIAKRGFAAACASQGREAVLGRVQKWRAEHPTNLEQIVISWLDQAGITYERHYPVQVGERTFYLDFAILPCHYTSGVPRQSVIETDGNYWHKQNDRASGPDWDAERDRLLQEAGWHILHLGEQEIKDKTGQEKITSILPIVLTRSGETTKEEVPF